MAGIFPPPLFAMTTTQQLTRQPSIPKMQASSSVAVNGSPSATTSGTSASLSASLSASSTSSSASIGSTFQQPALRRQHSGSLAGHHHRQYSSMDMTPSSNVSTPAHSLPPSRQHSTSSSMSFASNAAFFSSLAGSGPPVPLSPAPGLQPNQLHLQQHSLHQQYYSHPVTSMFRQQQQQQGGNPKRLSRCRSISSSAGSLLDLHDHYLSQSGKVNTCRAKEDDNVQDCEDLIDHVAPTTFESLLNQLRDQRQQLESLNSGTRALSANIQTLDVTLVAEQESLEIVQDGALSAMTGWETLWQDYSTLESMDELRQQPWKVAEMVKNMTVCDKKALFQLLVQDCSNREVYQLQRQVTAQRGHVEGFDLLQELPEHIVAQIVGSMTFMDLAACRSVCKDWNRRVSDPAILSRIIERYTHPGDNHAQSFNLGADSSDNENRHQKGEQYNYLCRLYNRKVRWRKGDPASVHSLVGHTNYVTSMKMQSGMMVTGGYDESVRVWDVATEKCLRAWDMGSAVSCVDLYVDPAMEGGGIVVAAFIDIGVVKVWPLHGALTSSNTLNLAGHQKGMRTLAVSENYLVTAGFDQSVLVWNWVTGRKEASFRAHNEVILSVHLRKNTLFTFCIDATLRVFDIVTRTQLNQVKLFDVLPGSSLQWSCLQENTLLTATHKKVYVWQLEHLEEFQSIRLNSSPRLEAQNGFSLSESKSDKSKGMMNDSAVFFNSDEQRQSSPPWSPSMSSMTLSTTSRPETPALSTCTTMSSYSSSSSSYFYPSQQNLSSVAGSVTEKPFSPLQQHELSPQQHHHQHSDLANFSLVDSRVNPCLTAVLSMNIDMWCGQMTRHEPPLLLVGSRTSAMKLVSVALTKAIIDPAVVYKSDHIPTQMSPTAVPVQGVPRGHGQGIMCIESDGDRLIIGCTGGSIHVLTMDPASASTSTAPSPTTAPTQFSRSSHFGSVPASTPLGIQIPKSQFPRSTSPTLMSSSASSTSSTSSSGTSPSSVSGVLPRRPPAALRSGYPIGLVVDRGSLPSPDNSPVTRPTSTTSSSSTTTTASYQPPAVSTTPTTVRQKSIYYQALTNKSDLELSSAGGANGLMASNSGATGKAFGRTWTLSSPFQSPRRSMEKGAKK